MSLVQFIMLSLFQPFKEALRLILSHDDELIRITILSLYVSLTGVFFAGVIAIPFGVYLGMVNFKGKKLIVNILNTFMGLPPVLVGLILFILFSRQGSFGSAGLLFTPTLMAFAQFIIAFPIIAGITYSSFEAVETDVLDIITSLGAEKIQRISLTLSEIRFGLLTALISGLGRAFSEVGAVLIVGGNIRGHTRVLTTAIVLETSRGEFDLAIALGLILLSIAFIVNYSLTILQEKSKR